MAVSTELVAFKALNISAGTPIAVPYPMYAEDEVQVYYGKDALLAVYNTDYTVTLQPTQFDTFTVTPTASLITKINDLIAADPTETNFVTIRSNLDYETSSTDSAVRYTPFTSREFDRTARRFAQVQDALNRALTLAPTFVGDVPMLQLNEVAPNRVLIFNAAGTAIEAGPTVTEIENAQGYAEDALASKEAAETAATNAAADASAAANSAVSASGSATAADASADAAAASQAAAANSASAASGSATAADASADAAASSQSAAATSATNAGNSATAAAGSATAANTSATNAANSATAAGTSATNAANSATAAQNSANAVAAKFVPDVLTASAAAAPGYISSANGFGYSQNTTGSTGYPGVFGETVSFMFGGGGRAWDMWKGASGAEDWHLRSNLSGGSTFGPWRRIIHDGLQATQSQAETGTDNVNYMTALRGMQQINKFGLGTVNPPQIANLDDPLTPAGNYAVAGATPGTKPEGTTGAGDVEVGHYAGEWAWQVYTARADSTGIAGNRYKRRYHANTDTWSAWSLILDEEAMFRVYGAGSLARSAPARFGDTIDMRDFCDRTGSDASKTGNDAAIIALIAYLNANPTIKTVRGHAGDVYRTSLVNRVIPAGVRFMFEGARFRWDGLLGDGNSQFIGWSGQNHVEGMGVDIVTGSTLRRFFTFETECTIYDLEIEAESQINNAPTSGLLDWAVRVYRDNNKVRRVKIVNLDKAFFGYGADGDGNPGNDNHFEDIRAVSYVTGICMRNQMRTKLINPYVSTRSPNATDDPGNNGILHEGVREYLLANAQVFDAGEHGIRFGGTRNAEQLSVGIIINGAQIVRSGQSGLKFFTGVAGGSFVNVQGSNIQVIDCQYEPETPAEGPGFNDEGFLLQQIRKGTFNGLSVQRQSHATYSCMDGVYISGADDLQINGLHVQDPKRNAVRISEYDGDTAPNSVETLANNEVFIRGLRGENIGEDGVFIDSPVQSLRDINIEGEVIGNGVAGFYAYDGSAAVARFAQPSIVQLKARNFAAGATSLATSGNWKYRDVFGTVY